MNICDLIPGEFGYIKTIQGDEKLAGRLMALGCIEGTKISIAKIAPLGDPLVLNVRGYNLAIRRRDAKNILIMEA